LVGIRFCSDGGWLTRKQGLTRRREERKVHLAKDPLTGDLRAVEFISRHKRERALLSDLKAQFWDSESVALCADSIILIRQKGHL